MLTDSNLGPDNNINSGQENDYSSPQCNIPPQRMSVSPTLKPTVANAPLPLSPIVFKPLLCLQSDLVHAALGDTAFLQWSDNFHQLILSTANGFQLGAGTDPAGCAHTDYIFLYSGLFDVSSKPCTCTQAHTFIRIFSGIESPDLQLWLLPYLGGPLTDKVSVPSTNLKSHANTKLLKTTKGDTLDVPSDLATMHKQHRVHFAADGASADDSRSLPASTSSTNIPGIITPNGITSSTPTTALSLAPKPSDSSQRCTSGHITTNGRSSPNLMLPPRLRPQKSPPPPRRSPRKRCATRKLAARINKPPTPTSSIVEASSDSMEVDPKQWEGVVEDMQKLIDEEDQASKSTQRRTTQRLVTAFRFFTGAEPTDNIVEVL